MKINKLKKLCKNLLFLILNSGGMNFLLLPDDIVNEIVLRLSVDDILKFAECDDNFRYKICEKPDAYIWKLLYKRDISEVELPTENYAFHYLHIIMELKEYPFKLWKYSKDKQIKSIPVRNIRKLNQRKKFADTNFDYDTYKEKAIIYLRYGIEHGYEKIVHRVLKNTLLSEIELKTAFLNAAIFGHVYLLKLLKNFEFSDAKSFSFYNPTYILRILHTYLEFSLEYHTDIEVPIYLIEEIKKFPLIEIPTFALTSLLDLAIFELNTQLVRYLLCELHVEPRKTTLQHFVKDEFKYLTDLESKNFKYVPNEELLTLLRPYIEQYNIIVPTDSVFEHFLYKKINRLSFF